MAEENETTEEEEKGGKSSLFPIIIGILLGAGLGGGGVFFGLSQGMAAQAPRLRPTGAVGAGDGGSLCRPGVRGRVPRSGACGGHRQAFSLGRKRSTQGGVSARSRPRDGGRGDGPCDSDREMSSLRCGRDYLPCIGFFVRPVVLWSPSPQKIRKITSVEGEKCAFRIDGVHKKMDYKFRGDRKPIRPGRVDPYGVGDKQAKCWAI